MKTPKWIRQFITAIGKALAREDVPEEKKRHYSISGWERGADGIYRSGSSAIFRHGKLWIRQDPIGLLEDREPADSEFETTWPTLHAAIKRELPEGPLFTAGVDVQNDRVEVEIREFAEQGDGVDNL